MVHSGRIVDGLYSVLCVFSFSANFVVEIGAVGFLTTECIEVCTEGHGDGLSKLNSKLNIRNGAAFLSTLKKQTKTKNSKSKSHLSPMNFTYKQVVILFIASMALVMLGMLFKIQHWPYGAIAIGAGLMAQLVAIVLLVMLLVKRK
jgi:hypothetical protein